jgi:hypothetical protein
MKRRKVKLTKAKAKQWLENARPNRNLSDQHVQRLTYMMNEDLFDWELETFKFDTEERMGDGQHRATAFFYCDKEAVWVNILEDCDEAVFMRIDQGRQRNLADVLRMNLGVKHHIIAASAVRILLDYNTSDRGYETFKNHHYGQPIEICYRYYIDHQKDIDSAIDFIAKSKVAGKYPNPGLLVALLVLWRKIDVEIADNFVERLLSETEGFVVDDPVFRLRKRIRAHYDRTRQARIPRGAMAALTIKAWNAHIKGERVGRLVYVSGEPYPTIHNPF